MSVESPETQPSHPSDDDPVQLLLRNIQLRPLVQPAGDEQSLDPPNKDSELPPLVSLRRPRSETASNLQEVIQHLKRRKKYTEESLEDLSLFSEVRKPLFFF